jgi:two-component system NtrC family sensor kinase
LHHAKEYTQGLMRILELYQQHCPEALASIEAESETIELDYLLEDLPKVFNSMQQGAERVRDIVLSLRNFCRLDEAEMKQVNIHDGINNTIMLLQSQLKGKPGQEAIAIHKEYSDLPLVQCYPGQLNQVFMNILVNAIYALVEWNKHENIDKKSLNNSQTAEKNDSLANSRQMPAIRISTELIEGKKVIIRIYDNGPGMTEDIRKRLFDPFFTTKPVGQGTGLGLSISYEIVVNQHGGELKCLSELGKGTEFAIKIPLQQFSPAQMLPRFA